MPGILHGALIGSYGATPKVLTFRTSGSSASSATCTVSSVTTGTAQADRYVVVTVGAVGSVGNVITGVTCDGNAMTQVVYVINSSSKAAIYILNVPTGTSSTIVVTFSGTISAIIVGVYTATGLLSSTAVGTNSQTVDNTATNLTTVANGFAIGVAITNATSTFTWNNLSEDYDVASGSRGSSGASISPNSSPSLSITCDGTSANNPAQVFASW